MDTTVDRQDLVRRPLGPWLYARGPRPPHRLGHQHRGTGVLSRPVHLRAAARRRTGRRLSR